MPVKQVDALMKHARKPNASSTRFGMSVRHALPTRISSITEAPSPVMIFGRRTPVSEKTPATGWGILPQHTYTLVTFQPLQIAGSCLAPEIIIIISLNDRLTRMSRGVCIPYDVTGQNFSENWKRYSLRLRVALVNSNAFYSIAYAVLFTPD